MPRRRSSSTVGWTTARGPRRPARRRPGSGEYAPMPPVFGPSSPSPTRLKSWAGWSGTTVVAVGEANSETSGPSRNSSMTTRPGRQAVRAWAQGLAAVVGDHHALAGRQSVVLDDVRRAERVERLVDLLGGRADVGSAVGTPAAAITSLAKALEPSSCAASLRGAEAGDARLAHGVGDPGDQRRLRADDDQVGAQLDGQRGDAVAVEQVDGGAARRSRRCRRCRGRRRER